MFSFDELLIRMFRERKTAAIRASLLFWKKNCIKKQRLVFEKLIRVKRLKNDGNLMKY